MNEHASEKNLSAPGQTEPELVVLIKKMQQQLFFLEEKIDILISQSREKNFRPFGRPPRREHFHDKRDERDDSRERNFRPGQDHHFKKKFDGGKRGFSPRKKPFFRARKGRE